jgi:hypothetical protein
LLDEESRDTYGPRLNPQPVSHRGDRGPSFASGVSGVFFWLGRKIGVWHFSGRWRPNGTNSAGFPVRWRIMHVPYTTALFYIAYESRIYVYGFFRLEGRRRWTAWAYRQRHRDLTRSGVSQTLREDAVQSEIVPAERGV